MAWHFHFPIRKYDFKGYWFKLWASGSRGERREREGRREGRSWKRREWEARKGVRGVGRVGGREGALCA